MTHHSALRSLALVATLSSLVAATAAKADGVGPDAIMLEQIGAVRMATPQEARQQDTSSAAHDSSPSRVAHQPQALDRPSL